jgi:hypothetical protein
MSTETYKTSSMSKTASEFDVRQFLARQQSAPTSCARLDDLKRVFNEHRLPRPNRTAPLHRG